MTFSNKMKGLFRVARLQFLVAGVALFVLGGMLAVLAGGSFSFMRLLLGYLVILPAQLSVHFSNDYFDVGSDRPGRPTLISGGGGVLLEHPELREPVKWIAVGLILASLLMGTIFLWNYAIPAWLFGFIVLGNLLGWCYSAPPFRFSQRGWGEVCYTFIAGLLVPGMGYLATERKPGCRRVVFPDASPLVWPGKHPERGDPGRGRRPPGTQGHLAGPDGAGGGIYDHRRSC